MDDLVIVFLNQALLGLVEGSLRFDDARQTQGLQNDEGHHRDQRDEPESIKIDILSPGKGKADAERKDKSRGHRTGSDAAGIEGHGGIDGRDEEAEDEGRDVPGNQIVGDRELEIGTDDVKDDGHANRPGQNREDGAGFDRPIRDVFDLMDQYVDRGLGQYPENAKETSKNQGDPKEGRGTS